MNRSMVFLFINLLISVFREESNTTWDLCIGLCDCLPSQGPYVIGLYLFEGCGVEAVMGGVCRRCPPKV